MFAPPEDPDDTKFEVYDLQYLVGTALIAWAFAISLALSLRLS